MLIHLLRNLIFQNSTKYSMSIFPFVDTRWHGCKLHACSNSIALDRKARTNRVSDWLVEAEPGEVQRRKVADASLFEQQSIARQWRKAYQSWTTNYFGYHGQLPQLYFIPLFAICRGHFSYTFLFFL